ncbi:Core-2/I-Branching enzyme, partial [Opisthorchis viverrini]
RKLFYSTFAIGFIFLLVISLREFQRPVEIAGKDSERVIADNCLRNFGIPLLSYTYMVTPVEKEFPLAFSLQVYTHPERVIRLLLAIHRPHNFYCVHVDAKSSKQYEQMLLRAAECIGPNIFFVPDHLRTKVRWGYFTELEPDLTCSRLLLARGKRWKYWINLTGQEFPIRTNLELVLALRALNGTNLVEAIYRNRYIERLPPEGAVDLNITWYKGSVHVVVRREFVEYMNNDNKAQQLLVALKAHESMVNREIFPDEAFFPTLNHNPHVFKIPGAFLGTHEETVTGLIPRLKIWKISGEPCGSKRFIRFICMLGIGDLPRLFTAPNFFANKFMPDIEPIAYDILEFWLASKTAFEAVHGVPHSSFNLSYYATHVMAWNHL